MPSFMRPEDLERLRFNQLRSQLYPTAPWLVEQAAKEQLARTPKPVAVLPQSMAQNKYKTPARTFAQSARSVVELSGRFGTPMAMPQRFTMEAVARPLNHLPPMRPVDMTPPLSRGVLQRPWLANQEELRAVARMRQDPATAYGTQAVIQTRTFPSTYVFRKV